jgi:hypothetical protein
MSSLNIFASTFFPPICQRNQSSHQDQVIDQLSSWNLSTKVQSLVSSVLNEWYSGRTLNSILQHWERISVAPVSNQAEGLKILCYNVEGWKTRALEVIDLVYKIRASICILTEV